MTTSQIRTDQAGDGLAIVVVEGEHDLDTSAELKREIESAIGASSSIVVDLAAATFVDSSILATLVDGGRRAGEAGLGYALSIPESASPGVRRVVQVTGLDAAVSIAAGIDDARRLAGAGVS